jgi:HEAT repeat protein/cyclophilin family peptidyl-prolyl cis-trans isomerase
MTLKSRVGPSALLVALALGSMHQLGAQSVAPFAPLRARLPLGGAEIDDIARLEMMEDHRQFDGVELARILGSTHPEVRRRAAVSIGRIADKRGVVLLRAQPLDRDTAVAASMVFAIGQLRDTSTIGWLDSLLGGARTPPTVAGEAAIALGKMKTAGARDVLARFLSRGTVGLRNTQAIREALLSIGRTPRGDIAPIVRWTASTNEEVRWRATWALFRPRDPAAVRALVVLSKDRSALVRSWAVRGLARPQADSVNLGAAAEARLLISARDPDRRVRTEAVRALGTYSDSAALKALVAALQSPDSWVSVSAAEGLGRARSTATVPALLVAAADQGSCALRVTSMNSLQTISPGLARGVAVWLVGDTVPYCRATAAQFLSRANADTAARLSPAEGARIDSALSDFRTARRAELLSADLPKRVAAIRAMGAWGDTTDLAELANLRAQSESLSAIAITSATAIAAIQRRASAQPALSGARGGAGGRGRVTPSGTRPLEEYRQIVERWVVPDYDGAPRPTAQWDTPRGPIVVELYPGDAPLATDDFVHTMEAGSMIGTEFTRVVPDFVDQQQTIRGGNTLRDEVNRHGLTRGNLAWATAGLDTGSPGYTLGHTSQPHNEGDFTSLGRVIGGMAAADRVELGDRILGAKMLTGGTKK